MKLFFMTLALAFLVGTVSEAVPRQVTKTQSEWLSLGWWEISPDFTFIHRVDVSVSTSTQVTRTRDGGNVNSWEFSWTYICVYESTQNLITGESDQVENSCFQVDDAAFTEHGDGVTFSGGGYELSYQPKTDDGERVTSTRDQTPYECRIRGSDQSTYNDGEGEISLPDGRTLVARGRHTVSENTSRSIGPCAGGVGKG
tara:strand:- start:239 stop:835 length:597 start_codon:yes stop_codon:yes gene_type:complete